MCVDSWVIKVSRDLCVANITIAFSRKKNRMVCAPKQFPHPYKIYEREKKIIKLQSAIFNMIIIWFG